MINLFCFFPGPRLVFICLMLVLVIKHSCMVMHNCLLAFPYISFLVSEESFGFNQAIAHLVCSGSFLNINVTYNALFETQLNARHCVYDFMLLNNLNVLSIRHITLP